MLRRNFLKITAAGASSVLMGCSDNDTPYNLNGTDTGTDVVDPPEVVEPGPDGNGGGLVVNDKPAFYIPNDDGTSVEFAVIGDVHSNGNILKGALEEIERRGIKNVLLIGDQADTFLTEEYIDGFSEPEAYIKMIQEEEFDKRLNLYPVRGNHEGLNTEHDNPLSPKTFDNMKSDWRNTIGQLLDTHDDLIFPEYIREDTGELLDCSALYAFILGRTLFIAGDPYITAAWTTLPYDREKILTYTSEGEPIYSYQDWVLVYDFMQQVIASKQGEFDHLIMFNHYPLAGRNHAGLLENEVGGVPVPGYFPQLETSGSEGITQKFLNLLSEHNAIFLSGHDHIFSKGLIYPQGASTDENEHIHYATYENPDDNALGSLAQGLLPENPIRQFIFGSCSQKHYDVTRYYADKYEVPLYTLATNRDAGKVSIFAQVKITGDLFDLSVWGNEHDFGSDGFKDQYNLEKQGQDVEQHFLDADNWQQLSALHSITNSQHLVVPPNYSYQTDITAETSEGYLGTSAQISDGVNTTFNGLDKSREGITSPAKYYGFAEELCFKWLISEHWRVFSDVLLINGMADQQGLVTDQNGNETDKSAPGVSIYNDELLTADTFRLGLSMESVPEDQEVTLAFYHEESEQWIELESYQEGGYLYADALKINGYFAIVAVLDESDISTSEPEVDAQA